jgi:DNA-directed RNA polymerase subunit beta
MSKQASVKSKQKVHFGASRVEHNNRHYFNKEADFVNIPNLIENQIISFSSFLNTGIKEILDEFSPIDDYSEKKVSVNFLNHEIETPKHTPRECIQKNTSYDSNLKVRVQIIIKESGEVKESDVFLGAIPIMTDRGSFIINGIERVVVSQIVRSDGATVISTRGENGYIHTAKIIPKRGAWLEIEYDTKGLIGIKIDRRRKIMLTTFLRALGYEKDKDILALFADITKDMKKDPITATLEKDPVETQEEAFNTVYKRVRPGDPVISKNAKSLFESMFYNIRRYDLGNVARYKMNQKFNTKLSFDHENKILRKEDVIALIRQLILVADGKQAPDDIDFLANRRIKGVGEIVEAKFRIGMSRLERIAKDRLSVIETDSITANQIINARPVTAAMHEFFATSQLSQFMDQTNPLSEIASKRRLSALGPGGLSRERAGFEVRDVHTSHYGRICPVATPEGPNIGLVTQLASYAKINEYGFIETPFRILKNTVKNTEKELINRISSADIYDGKKCIAKKDEYISADIATQIVKIKTLKKVSIRSYVSEDYKYFDAAEEQGHFIAQGSSELDEYYNFVNKRVAARRNGVAQQAYVGDLTLIDIAPKQIFSIETSLIPFVEHDDAVRASMGTNMMRQAVPVVRAEAPIVGTGIEYTVGTGSGYVILAEDDGVVKHVSGDKVVMSYQNGKEKTYNLHNFEASNQSTLVHQSPRVLPEQKIKKGTVLVDAQGIENGELAIGKNLLVAYMSWKGYNFEDAVIVSDRVFVNDTYSSVHIEESVCDIRETKLGVEQMTRDIPNVSGARLQDLDEDGVIRIGASVKEGDILVGKITPKGETDLTPEERLLQAIFGEKAKDIKDSSLKVSGGKWGKVIHVQILHRKNGDDLPSGVCMQVKVYIAQLRKISVGDKMAGRHGNKGVISKIVPIEDMPHLADGTPVDIILNPLGVSSRMNLGQIFETTVGWAAQKLGIRVATPSLDGIKDETITKLLKEAGIPEDGKMQLYDGLSGEAFDHKTTVGITYMMKLHHLVEDKIHARSVGPYSLVTQQPLGGKAQHGGQRFGEMEVWALEAYSAAHALQEMLTIKSDDTRGRSRAYESIIKNEDIRRPSLPESFNVLVRELQSLALKVRLVDDKNCNHELDEIAEDELKIEEDTLLNTPLKEKIDMISDVTSVNDEALNQEEVFNEENMVEQDIEQGNITPDGMDENLKRLEKENI